MSEPEPKCCGCCPLQTVVIIFCIFEIIAGISGAVNLSASSGEGVLIVAYVLLFGSSVFGLYGAIRLRRTFIAIYFYVRVIYSILVFLAFVIMIALSELFCSIVRDNSDRSWDRANSTCQSFVRILAIILLVVYLPLIVWYLWVIKRFENWLKNRDQGGVFVQYQQLPAPNVMVVDPSGRPVYYDPSGRPVYAQPVYSAPPTHEGTLRSRRTEGTLLRMEATLARLLRTQCTQPDHRRLRPASLPLPRLRTIHIRLFRVRQSSARPPHTEVAVFE